MTATATTDDRARNGRVAVAGLALLGFGTVAYFALGMPGMDHGSEGVMAGMEHAAAGEAMALAPRPFADRLRDADAFVVDVRVAADTRIPGTDAAIAAEDLVGGERLPADRAQPILLYGTSGRAPAAAGRDLVGAGYTDVSYLDGGTDAWQRAGLELELEDG